MNRKQVARQLKFLLEAALWTAGVPVFAPDSIIISAGVEDEQLRRFPVAVIVPGAFQADPQTPALLKQQFVVRLLHGHAGDALGQAALIGSHRQGATSPDGKGILDVEDKLFAALELLGRLEGMNVILAAGTAARAGRLGDEGPNVVLIDYEFGAKCTTRVFYHPGKALSATGGSGQAVLAWKLPGARFDYRRMVLRRAVGAVPPATVTDGTGVALGGAPDGVAATGVTDVTGAATYSYSLFAVYDEDEASADGPASAAISSASVVVA